MTYASPIWGFVCKTSMDLLRKPHNKILRAVSDANWYLRNSVILRDLNTCKFRKRINILANKFYKDIYKMNIEIIAELPDYEASDP